MSAYRLHTSQGIIGPVKLETARELIDAGVVTADALASRDNAPFISLVAIPELASCLKPKSHDGEPLYSGDVGVTTFFRVLYRLYGERAHGLLIARDAVLRKDVYLETGQPVFVSSTAPKERFGEFLVARRRLTAEGLRTALTAANETHQPLGETLVRLGLLTDKEVRDCLREQQMTRLIDLCGWEHGRYAFHADTRYQGPKIDLGLQSPELWVRAARSLSDKSIMFRLGDYWHQVVMGFDTQLIELCRTTLNGDERVAVTLFNGDKTAVEVVAAEDGSPNRRRAALTVLYLFWELGGVRFRKKA